MKLRRSCLVSFLQGKFIILLHAISGSFPPHNEVNSDGDRRPPRLSEEILLMDGTAGNQSTEESRDPIRPVPLMQDSKAPGDDKSESRLYIGNLDQRITESAVLKMFAPFGNIVSEDFLWHTRGPKRGEPRGYAFIQYSTKEEAQLAKARMDGRLACGRPLVVHFANEKYFAETNAMKSAAAGDRKNVTAGGGGGAASSSGQTSRAATIAAIRSKLKSLEEERAGGKKPRLSENPPHKD